MKMEQSLCVQKGNGNNVKKEIIHFAFLVSYNTKVFIKTLLDPSSQTLGANKRCLEKGRKIFNDHAVFLLLLSLFSMNHK